MQKALEVLLNQFNAQIESLNKDGFKIYDEENQGFFLSGFYYNKEDDKLYFTCEEEQ